MIQESYVTFEQAKALKELGFPQGDALTCKYQNDGVIHKAALPVWNHDISCPTLSLVQKWLREEKGIILIPTPMVSWDNIKEQYYNPHYECCYSKWNSPILSRVLSNTKDGLGNYKVSEFETYEQALSAGIDKCIELLNNNISATFSGDSN